MTAIEAQRFLEQYLHSEVVGFEQLPASGSSRVNFIGTAESHNKWVVTYNENLRENDAFIYFSEVFSKLKLNTPKIFKVSDDRTTYIQSFLGTHTLSQLIAQEGESEHIASLVKKTLQALYHLQNKTLNKIDYHQSYEYERYDKLPIIHDLYYFKNYIVDILELHYHKSTLLKEFECLTQLIENLEPKGLMIRDFQSRNIMVNSDDEVGFIDYQAAMEGPLMYDVVSFLFQAKANFSEEFKQQMLSYYWHLFDDKTTQEQLKTSLPYIQLIRFMQVLGAYGFRGLIQRKPHFLESLSQGISNLYQFAQQWEGMSQFSELAQVIHQLNQHPITKDASSYQLY